MSVVVRKEAESRFPYLTTNGNDHKAWAKRILYREERKDSSLSVLQIKFAREAMGLDQTPGQDK